MTLTDTPKTSSSLPAPGATILDLLRDRVRARGDSPALRSRDAHDRWVALSWREYGTAIAEVAALLRTSGIAHGDRVAILSWNRPEWQIADLAILSIGAISVPIYPTSASVQIGYVLSHSAARAVFVEDAEQLGRILEQQDQLPELTKIVVFDNDLRSHDPRVVSMADVRASGALELERDPAVVERETATVALDDVATLVYTSGTTGPPKGAVITHANIMSMLRSVTEIVPLSPTDRFLSFLPLSHITERSVSHFGLLASGGETWFARSISTVAQDLPECRPTIFFAVPRVWEKFHEAIEEEVAKLAGPAGVLARRFLALADARGREIETRDTPQPAHMPFLAKTQWLLLHNAVGTKLYRQLGLDRARIVVSGAAPIHPSLVRWFHGIGLPIAEGYGQTEVALATTLNPAGAIRIGTVGPPLPGVSVSLAEDGEILVKGGNVCKGYWHDDAQTRELFDDDGWMRSGDLGRFDERGYLEITGRKKDLIVTAHGKNISPQELETDLVTHPLIGQAVVIGDGRRYLTALLALDGTATEAWGHEHNKGMLGLESLSRDADLHDELQAAIDAVNARHARVEHIRNWRVLPRELTVSGGELTPTLKVKRAVVNERYSELIADMYAQPRRRDEPTAENPIVD